ncbi:hypothetical protein BO86DRAFT_458692 [Aspergillus japonicus CBS 114.51]|uniref:Uncharacterized protein n=1 Tax=Aspergillus japonicus CBS 114.51 TaxID=1448312 RepID=A0A8T8WQT4_ASPJA|nr:hypothetical protein BO86DRAFT_458692 [Aspergillus japonicus CBS 114.51]RAH78216.1 hypothetical protein BO86DRAFT_458692 [Aspergillus japonicus CBS 114.51]
MSSQPPRAPRHYPQGQHLSRHAPTHPQKNDEDTPIDQLRAELGAHNLQFGIFKQQLTSQLTALLQSNNALIQTHQTLQQENTLLRDEVARLGREAAHQRAELATLRSAVHAAAGERQEDLLRADNIMQGMWGQIQNLWTELRAVDEKARSELFGWLRGSDVLLDYSILNFPLAFLYMCSKMLIHRAYHSLK